MAKRSKKGGGCTGGMQYEGGSRRRTMRGGAYGVGEAITPGALAYDRVDISGPVPGGARSAGDPAPNSVGSYAAAGGRRRSRRTRRKSVAQIKRLLKAKGMKVSGSRRALTARARKARIPLKGGGLEGGTPYGAYVGAGAGGMANQTTGVHPGGDGVQQLPGV